MHLVEELLTILKPAIKSHRKAQKALEEYWADKRALIWISLDVHRAANEVEVVLTEAQARNILEDLWQHHNKQYGLKWKDLTDIIQENVLGRPITKRELHRFVHQDVVAVERNRVADNNTRAGSLSCGSAFLHLEINLALISNMDFWPCTS